MRILALILLLLLTVITNAQDISISSSSSVLNEKFEWAKKRARSFVVTGKTGPINIWEIDQESENVEYIPSYWAGYPLRTAFYSRDFCHQAVGAKLLGLDTENFTMMQAFAASATESRKWYPLWALNFDGSIYTLDYRGEDDFVREVPATFELVEKAYKLYLWTGDRRYIEDPILWNYYTKAVTSFIEMHDDKIPNGIAEGFGNGDIFSGVATFNEQHDVRLVEAGDGIACQYTAFLAYSAMAKERGQKSLAAEYSKKAKELKKYFNSDWGVAGTDTYNRGYTIDKKAVAGWGKENSWFMPMKGIVDASSERTQKYIDYIGERLDSRDDIPDNIEAISYIPEMFFMYNRNDEGWKWLSYIFSNINTNHITGALTGKNGDYPEVSYIIISNVVEGLAGVSVNAARAQVSTASHLPSTVSQLSVDNIKMGDALLSISHEGQESSTLGLAGGAKSITWKACFAGEHRYLYINGKKQKSRTLIDNGVCYSYLELKLNNGDKTTVSVK